MSVWVALPYPEEKYRPSAFLVAAKGRDVDLTAELTIDEYPSLAGFSVLPYTRENFIPLVWSDYDERIWGETSFAFGKQI